MPDMRRGWRIFALAAACLLAVPAVQAQDTPATQPALAAAHNGIVALMLQDEHLGSATDKLIESMIAQLGESAEMQEMEAEYPGILVAVAKDMRPIIDRESAKALPFYKADLAALYARNFNEAEAREILTFYRSPEMSAFRASITRNMGMRATVRDAVKAEGISSQAIKSDMAAASLAASLELDSSVLTKVKGFFASPIGVRLTALNPQKLEIDTRWTNEISPEGEAEIERAVIDSMVTHIAKTDPETAAAMHAELTEKR